MQDARPYHILLFAVLVAAQTTYTGCHNHSSVEWCYGPNGIETPLVTYTALSASITPTATLPSSNSASVTSSGQTTAVTGCHTHEAALFCINGAGNEVQVQATVTGEPPAQYTGCHSHETELYCYGPDQEEVLVLAQATTDTDGGEPGGENCHFHAGVEHCLKSGESESAAAVSCDLRTRDYNIALRIGTLFAILVTSSCGVFAPMVLSQLSFISINGLVLSVLKNFGTGVIVATAFIHLYTHAYLMFNNPCLGGITYEATTSAIVMAGIFLSFLVEYVGHRLVLARARKHNPKGATTDQASSERAGADKESPEITLTAFGHSHGPPSAHVDPNSHLSVLVMEAGIVFHSILIGLTLVVAGDSFYVTLFIVIVFHQFFEGLALGSRIAMLPSGHRDVPRSQDQRISYTRRHPMVTKIMMAGAYALVTPLGMAIGISVLNKFNGNDPSTIVAIGTLDALSAGILVWVGVVDMWARDWAMEGGEMVDASLGKVLIVGFSLVAGMALMGLLGKWA